MHKLSISLLVLALTLFNLPPASATVIDISAQGAYNFLDPENSSYKPDAYLLDVRTPAEWLEPGHPGESATGAGTFLEKPDRKVTNIPYWFKNAGVFTTNPDFVAEVNSEFSHADYLLIMCSAGTRSFLAAQELDGLGFTHIYNVSKGFFGDWLPAGLPLNHSTVGMFTPTAVPEPCTLVLLASGLLGLTVCRRRKSV